jgi:hypothetical protein
LVGKIYEVSIVSARTTAAGLVIVVKDDDGARSRA